MTITSPTSVVDNINNVTNKGNTAAAKAQTNYQDFLKLLTTQLQNQDPSAPTDTNQLTQQIATLSQVEQQINTNSNLQTLISMFGSTSMNSLVGYIGKQVETAGDKAVLQNSFANVVYSLPTAAQTADVQIKDATGAVVLDASGTTFAGRNQVSWNGLDNSGNQLPDGTYTVSITAKDAAGNPITATTSTVGVATAVDSNAGVTSLSLGDVSVALDKILRVS